MVTTSAPNAIQETLDTGALESELDPLFDGDINIEQGVLEVNDNANHQETTAQENGDLQAALFDDTDNNILSRRQMSTTIRWQALTIHNVKLLIVWYNILVPHH